MREILLTSSVLILAVLLLRRAFRDRISRRAQYVLWALVLVRMLVPVVAGTPARIIKMKDARTEGKTALVDALRSL